MPDQPIPKTTTKTEPSALAPSRPTQNRQVPPQRWQIFPSQKAQAKQIAQATALSPLLAQVLINRGIYTPEQAWEFLDPETLLLPSPLDEFPDLEKSLDLLVRAIEIKEKILICGDYDADGMTSTALLMRSLRYLGAQVDYAIPSRMDEGYGINQRIVEDFHADGGSIILTVDNGIAAYDPIARARELDLTVILTDHHAVPDDIPPANAILNPQLIRESSPYRGVAGVGVAYILAVCLAQRMDRMQDLTATLLALFTLGTIADLAPLTGVNRRWVKRGLKLLPKSRIPGVQALIEVAGLSEATDLKPESIGFRLGPRINAVGRISDPQIVIELLTTDDIGVALQRAMQCEEANQLRRQMCEIIEQQAVDWCEDQIEKGLLDLNKERVLVVVQPEWHHGVIGIVASRLVERYGVPVFIGTYEDKSKKEIRGSARSIPEFNVVEALRFCDDLLGKYGGHRAAGGFSFAANKLRQVKSRLSNFACKHLQPEHLKPLVTADVQAQLAEADLELFSQIDQIHPCGIENPDPVFWTANVAVVEQKVIGKASAHLKLTLAHTAPEGHASSGEKVVMKAIAWRWGTYYPLPRSLDIAYKLRLNEWKGRRSVELELVGVRPATPVIETTAGIRPWSAEPLKSTNHPPQKNSHLPADLNSGSSTSVIAENANSSDSSTAANQEPDVSLSPSAKAAKAIALQLQQNLTQNTQSSTPISFKVTPTKDATHTNSHNPTLTPPDDTPLEQGQQRIDDAALLAAIPPENERQDSGPPTASENTGAQFDVEGLGTHVIPTPLHGQDASTMHVEFYHSQRRYKGTLEKTGEGSQLTIQNADAHLLVVQMSERKGFLYLPEQAPQMVDIADMKYFNLIRAGLGAIETKQKTQLLIRKDELLAEKDDQISTMKAQIELLEEKITQLSTEQQRQFAELRTALQSQESNIQGKEAHIEQLQVQVSSAPLPTSADIKQQVRDAVGDSVWFCLAASSQKDLQAAYKNYQMIHSSGPDAHIADYSEAGIRLSFAIEREVMKPFFTDLSSFLAAQGKQRLGTFLLNSAQADELCMMPPLLADQWRSFPPGELGQQSLRESGVNIVKVKATAEMTAAMTGGDRTLLTQFFEQWEHPMADCLHTRGRQAASSLDQISKLRSIAIHPESFLYRWQYELLHQLIAGKNGKGGLLRQIFA